MVTRWEFEIRLGGAEVAELIQQINFLFAHATGMQKNYPRVIELRDQLKGVIDASVQPV